MSIGSIGGPKIVEVTGGTGSATNPVPVTSLFGSIEVAVNSGDATITYIGYAAAGTATSAASWRIAEINVTGTATEIQFADGNTNFDNIWDNREALVYS